MMKNLVHLRNTKKGWLVYALGLFMFCSVCLAFKNFNDKMTMMGDSVHRYQGMMSKQSEQLSDMTKENERVKRDLKHAKEIHTGNMKEMEERFNNLQEDCKHETTRLENEVGEIQDNHNSLIEDHRKLENKYKTISKANSAAISDVENLKQENKKLRVQLHDATTSKTSELIDLRDKLDKMSKDLAQSRDQYKALFKQHQQSQDNIQLLQTDRDKLQEQIREIQKLSHGAGARSSSAPSDQAGPAAAVSPLSSSTQRALSPVAQVMEEPGPVPLPGGSSSSSPAPMAPPVEEPDHNQAMIDAAAALVRYPRVHQAIPQQFVQPLQPARHQEEEQEEEEEDDSFDVLNAPPQYQKQSEYNLPGQFYPGGQVHYGAGGGRQVQPLGGQYYQGGAGGQAVQHGERYRVQQPQPVQQPRYQRGGQEQVYGYGGYNNEIQDFYRQKGRQRDF